MHVEGKTAKKKRARWWEKHDEGSRLGALVPPPKRQHHHHWRWKLRQTCENVKNWRKLGGTRQSKRRTSRKLKNEEMKNLRTEACEHWKKTWKLENWLGRNANWETSKKTVKNWKSEGKLRNSASRLIDHEQEVDVIAIHLIGRTHDEFRMQRICSKVTSTDLKKMLRDSTN